jgi:hypothetical protein
MTKVDGDSIDKEIESSNLEKLLESDTQEYVGLKLRKMTPASISLLEMAKLQMLHGNTEYASFEILAFLFIHSRKPREARRAVLDKSLGKDDDTGRNLAFINAVMDFGEELSVEDWTKATNKVTEMVEEAFGGQPEPIQDTTEDKIKKKEEDSEETPEPTTS